MRHFESFPDVADKTKLGICISARNFSLDLSKGGGFDFTYEALASSLVRDTTEASSTRRALSSSVNPSMEFIRFKDFILNRARRIRFIALFPSDLYLYVC